MIPKGNNAVGVIDPAGISYMYLAQLCTDGGIATHVIVLLLIFSDSVVIGDPVANTHFNIRFSKMSLTLTSSSHYLPATPTLLVRSHSSSTGPQRDDLPSSRPLPCLCVVCDGLDVDMDIPMYRKNAIPGLPQKQMVHARVHTLRAASSSVRDLGGSMALLSEHGGKQEAGIHHFLDVPLAELVYDSVKHCDVDADAEEVSKSDTFRTKLDVTKGTCALSCVQLTELLYVYRSWTMDEADFSALHPRYLSPLAPLSLSNLDLSLSGLVLSKTSNSQFVSRSLILGAARGAVMRGDGGGRRGSVKCFPFFYGPFDTNQWNCIEQYQQRHSLQGCEGPFTRNLVELSTTTPTEEMEGLV